MANDTLVALQRKAVVARANYRLACAAINVAGMTGDRRQSKLREKYNEAKAEMEAADKAYNDAFAESYGFKDYEDLLTSRPVEEVG